MEVFIEGINEYFVWASFSVDVDMVDSDIEGVVEGGDGQFIGDSLKDGWAVWKIHV
ncbi:MAG: hypothetical protein ACYCOU_13380 [Sulfobacillus sp.]